MRRSPHLSEADLVLGSGGLRIFWFELDFVSTGFFRYKLESVARLTRMGVGFNFRDSLRIAQTDSQIRTAMIDDYAGVLAFCQLKLENVFLPAGEFAFHGLTDGKDKRVRWDRCSSRLLERRPTLYPPHSVHG